MTTIAARLPLTRRGPFASAAHAMVVIGLAPAIAHMLDPWSLDNVLTALPFVAAAAVLALAYPSLPRPLAAWLALVAGALAVADGGIHVAHARAAGGPDGSDVMGFLTGLGGIAMLAAATSFVLRPHSRRRWLYRLGAVAVVPPTLLFAIMPLFAALYLTHKPGVQVAAADLQVAHQDVVVHAGDGVELPAWYVPSRNGRAVIVLHGSGGNRGGSAKSRIELLARHGYGVLAYDARRGDGLGWTWYSDLYGAIAYIVQDG